MKLLRFICRLSETVLVLLALFGFFLVVCWGRGCKPFAVLSGSMEPAIHVGSLVLTDQNRKQPTEGDIITFRMDRDFVTHRVVREEGDGWITKGDANDFEDAVPVKKEQLVGIVWISIPAAGFILYRFRSITTVWFLLSLILLIFFMDHLLTSRESEKGACEREHKEEIEKTE